MPGIGGGIVLEGLPIGRDRLLQRLARTRAGLVAGVEEDLLEGPAKQARGFGEFQMVLRQTLGQRPQDVDRRGRLAGLDQVLRVETAVLGILRIVPAHGLGELSHAVVLARVAELLDEPLGGGEGAIATQTPQSAEGIVGALAQLVEQGVIAHDSALSSMRRRAERKLGWRRYFVAECRQTPSFWTAMSSTAAVPRLR